MKYEARNVVTVDLRSEVAVLYLNPSIIEFLPLFFVEMKIYDTPAELHGVGLRFHRARQ